MPNLPFKQVDVFTSVRFKGNPVAVVMNGDGLAVDSMQQIANWTNLSETTFVLPPTDPTADYQLRIFTPNAELPFAGHPTIGTAHALLESGLIRATDGLLVQQCAGGLIRLAVGRADDGEQWISFDLPDPKLTPLDADETRELEEILGGLVKGNPSPMVVDVGPRWLVAQLDDAEAVLALRPDTQRMKIRDVAKGYTGVTVFGEYERGADARIEVRSFVPAHGIDEDPVCGSGNGSVAAYIRATGQTEHIGRECIASQGMLTGRAGMVRLNIREERIQVGGSAVTCIEGEMRV